MPSQWVSTGQSFKNLGQCKEIFWAMLRNFLGNAKEFFGQCKEIFWAMLRNFLGNAE